MASIQIVNIRILSGEAVSLQCDHTYILEARLVDTESKQNEWGYSWDKGISVADDDLEYGAIRLGNAITIAICYS